MIFAMQGCPFDAFNHKTFGLYFEGGTVKMGALESPTSAQPKELDTALAKGGNVIDLQSATLSNAVDKSKRNQLLQSIARPRKAGTEFVGIGRAPHC
jgi:hypothetical protein